MKALEQLHAVGANNRSVLAHLCAATNLTAANLSALMRDATPQRPDAPTPPAPSLEAAAPRFHPRRRLSPALEPPSEAGLSPTLIVRCLHIVVSDCVSGSGTIGRSGSWEALCVCGCCAIVDALPLASSLLVVASSSAGAIRVYFLET